jgi:glutamate/tyrosine decarboxylase-like PLP-dependent enzyme
MKTLTDSINALEARINQIEPDQGKRQYLNNQVIKHIDKFLEHNAAAKAYQADFNAEQSAAETAISETPVDIAKLLAVIEEHIEQPGVNTTSGNYFGYIPCGGLYTAALGDYISAVINRYSSLFFMAPGAVQIEKTLIQWVMQLVGYPDTAFGNITSGASLATLMAVVTARTARQIASSDYKKMVVYLGPHTHYCFVKALQIAGMGEVTQRMIPLDKHHCMDTAILNKTLDEDSKNGLTPWIIVATAGTTDTGKVDPLTAIYEIADQHKVWLHVDAAYGGFFMLAESGKKILTGLHLADSIVMDAHKALFMPYGIAVLLIKDHQKLLAAHHYTANILQDTVAHDEQYSPANLSPELTRPFRGLRLWLSLQLLGVEYFRDALEEKLLLAQYFYEKISSLNNIETYKPDLSIVVFRYVPTQGDADRFNHALQQALLKDGRIFLSSTKINGHYYLRLACLSFRSHLDNVEFAIEVLREVIADVEGS